MTLLQDPSVSVIHYRGEFLTTVIVKSEICHKCFKQADVCLFRCQKKY